MKKFVFLAVIAAVVIAFFIFNLGGYLSFERLQEQQQWLASQWQAQPWRTVAIFAAAYVLIATLSLPVATVMTLAAGFLFGRWWGVLIASLCSTIGAGLSFLIARFFLRDWVERISGPRLRKIRAGIDRAGGRYLLTLRLIPLLPFWLINLGMATTGIALTTFVIYSWIGMLPATFVYVNAGTELAEVDSLGDILSPGVIGSLLLLAAFPQLARLAQRAWQYGRRLRGHRRPATVDYDLIVIGAGAGGLVAAAAGAAVGARVALIEAEEMGGDCLHTGCVPSKTLLHQARLQRYRRAPATAADFARTRSAIKEAIDQIRPHDSPQRYRDLGVDCLAGKARLIDPWTVGVGEARYTTRRIIVASGARPRVPDLAGSDQVDYLTSDSLWDLEHLPEHLLIIGGGPIGCEIAQAFIDLGSRVSLLHAGEWLLPQEDRNLGEALQEGLRARGVQIFLQSRATGLERSGEARVVQFESADGKHSRLSGDAILIALGRTPQTHDLGLQELGVELDDHGRIRTDERLRSHLPTVYAVGDCASPLQFTHVAGAQGWRAAISALLDPFWSISGELPPIPRCTYTDPEVASIGLTERQAQAQRVRYEVHELDLQEVDRYVTEAGTGRLRLLLQQGSDRILGASMIGQGAGEIIACLSVAMANNLGLSKFLQPVLPYPTRMEVLSRLAQRYRQAQVHPRWRGIAAWIWRQRRSRRRTLLLLACLGLLLLGVITGSWLGLRAWLGG